MKFRVALVATALSLAWAGNALAERPLLKVEERIQVAASPAKVWAVVGQFGDLGWHPVIASTEITKGKDGRKGAERTLTAKDGAKFVEELLARSDGALSLKYRIVSAPLPVSDYVSTLKVSSAKDGGSIIAWSSQFRRKDEKPVEGADDTGVRKIVSGIYTSGLDNLKKQLEAGKPG
ncbi:SRPBCC family protein [Dechloromonas sp. XY25]|uniref:SRPBCC family protein n=1 Tax=Dechloromonas hankyongensis TaxID=2908002 RepID=A0ABS9K0M1_9RHOO|nr:SRPBCC family protein [Dechloromonas hankyongensis]MCG2576700.1 SRPBCC family protein [Dechloromonas hankyongensis]